MSQVEEGEFSDTGLTTSFVFSRQTESPSRQAAPPSGKPPLAAPNEVPVRMTAITGGSEGAPGGISGGGGRGDTERMSELLGGRGSEWERARSLSQSWLRRMATTDRPLDERLTLLWHSHFASGLRTAGSMVWLYEQHEMFRELGTGWAGNRASFAEVARAVVRDPAMLRFLDNDVSGKTHPNENLSRTPES